MKVRERIDVVADLMLGAMYADRCFSHDELQALRDLLCDLLVLPELPAALAKRIAHFSPQGFDLHACAVAFQADPPMRPRRLLELIAKLCLADGELDFDEDEYLHRLARALGMNPSEYDDIVLDYEMRELDEVESQTSRPGATR